MNKFKSGLVRMVIASVETKPDRGQAASRQNIGAWKRLSQLGNGLTFDKLKKGSG